MSRSAAVSSDFRVAVVGGGVVGAATAFMLRRRGVPVVLLEAQGDFGLGASGTNSGILHTGFDSRAGELETRLILRAGTLRDPVLDELGVPVRRCGAVVAPDDDDERATVAEMRDHAVANGVDVRLGPGGTLEVPGESVTDPVAFTLALAGAARADGAEVRTRFRVAAIEPTGSAIRLAEPGGDAVTAQVVVNCAGLYADEVARLAGDESFEIYPRKGEFFVFDPPAPLERILLPVPTKQTKGVLVFPTIDGKVIAGPTAHDQDDKEDWSVRPDAAGEVLPKAARMFAPLEGAEPIATYAGLRPAGRGVNYAIGQSAAFAGLINVAAIRSTGLTASLGIAEHVVGLVAEHGVALEAERSLPAPDPDERGTGEPWWRRTARHRAGVAS
jgi:glycerol-3-phosphate dehydrogenase